MHDAFNKLSIKEAHKYPNMQFKTCLNHDEIIAKIKS